MESKQETQPELVTGMVMLLLHAAAAFWVSRTEAGWIQVGAACAAGLTGVLTVLTLALAIRQSGMQDERRRVYADGPTMEAVQAELMLEGRGFRRAMLGCLAGYVLAAVVLLRCLNVPWLLTGMIVGGVAVVSLLLTPLLLPRSDVKLCRSTLTDFEYRKNVRIRNDEVIERIDKYWVLEGYGAWLPVEDQLVTFRELRLEDFGRGSRFILVLQKGRLLRLFAEKEFHKAWEAAEENFPVQVDSEEEI